MIANPNSERRTFGSDQNPSAFDAYTTLLDAGVRSYRAGAEEVVREYHGWLYPRMPESEFVVAMRSVHSRTARHLEDSVFALLTLILKRSAEAERFLRAGEHNKIWQRVQKSFGAYRSDDAFRQIGLGSDSTVQAAMRAALDEGIWQRVQDSFGAYRSDDAFRQIGLGSTQSMRDIADRLLRERLHERDSASQRRNPFDRAGPEFWSGVFGSTGSNDIPPRGARSSAHSGTTGNSRPQAQKRNEGVPAAPEINEIIARLNNMDGVDRSSIITLQRMDPAAIGTAIRSVRHAREKAKTKQQPVPSDPKIFRDFMLAAQRLSDPDVASDPEKAQHAQRCHEVATILGLMMGGDMLKGKLPF